MHQLQHQTYVRNFLETYIPQPSPFPPPLDKWRRRYNTVVYPMLSVLRRYTVEKVPTHGAKIWEDAALTLALCVNVLYASIHIHPDLIEQQDDSNEPIFQVFSPTHSHKLKEPLVPATGNPWLCGLVELLGLCTFVASIGICLSLAFVHFPPKLQQYRTLKTEATAAPHQWMHWCWQGFWELTPKLKWYYGYSLLLVPASLLGVKVSPLFFMAHLLILIGRSNVAQNVIEAMTANGTSLLMTLILGMFIVYVCLCWCLHRAGAGPFAMSSACRDETLDGRCKPSTYRPALSSKGQTNIRRAWVRYHRYNVPRKPPFDRSRTHIWFGVLVPPGWRNTNRRPRTRSPLFLMYHLCSVQYSDNIADGCSCTSTCSPAFCGWSGEVHNA